jgi:hypothetical protein
MLTMSRKEIDILKALLAIAQEAAASTSTKEDIADDQTVWDITQVVNALAYQESRFL